MLLAGYIELLRNLMICSRLVMPVVFSHLLPRVACDFLLCSCLLLAALGSRMSSRLKHNTWGKSMLRCACVEPQSQELAPEPPSRVRVVLRPRAVGKRQWSEVSASGQRARRRDFSSQKE